MVTAGVGARLALSLVAAGCIDFHDLPLPQPTSPHPVPTLPAGLRAGFGRADITPPPGVGLAGNGPEGRRAVGYRVRLYARVLLLEDRTGERIAFLVADLPQVTANLHRLTAKAIRDSTGIGADRLVVAATHVHAGPSHFYADRQYNQSSSQVEGYDSAMVEFLVERFTRAVLDAQRDLRLARVAWGSTAVWGHTRNRSYEAFLRNKPEWTPPAPVTPGIDPAHRAVNPLWTLLRVDQRGLGTDSAYRPAGALSVFALHGTADAPENELLDAGIHGIMERGLERHVNSLNGGRSAFHVLANGAEGDVSPDWPAQSRCGPPMLRPVVAPGGPRTPAARWEWRDPAPAWMGLCLAAARHYVNTAGDSLAARAAALFDSLGPALRGDLRVGVAFRTLRLKGDPRLCPNPEAGTSTLGGAKDGRTRLYGWRLFGIFPLGLEGGGPAVRQNPHDCQREKRVALGSLQRKLVVGEHGLPEAAQLSVIRLGDLLLGVVPAELTTRAGAQIEHAIADSARASGLKPRAVAMVGLANGYMQYVTTDAEYGEQAYEGGSTLYGPNTAAVLSEELGKLAGLLARSGASPANPIDSLVAHPGTSQTILPRRTAGPPPERVTRTVLGQSCVGDTLVVRWRDLHPGRLVPADGPVLRIERLVGDGWETVVWDDDRELEVRAVRSLGSRGYVWEARWRHPARAGAFRVVLVERQALAAVTGERAPC
jgi:neutral ceramidase